MEESFVKILDIRGFPLPEKTGEVILPQSDDEIADVLTDTVTNPSASQKHVKW